jgi:tRNA pseudouridine55 synthase
LKRRLGERKLGHSGTLDPLARGVLIVATGRLTRLLRYCDGHDKSYQAIARLGVVTTTGDVTGAVERTCDASSISQEELDAVLDEFRGPIEQRPHRFSAIKVDGVRSYDRARRGESFVNAARPVRIDELSCELQGDEYFSVALRCSSGTYVRVLIEDIGERLGVGATMVELVRVAAGPVALDRCSSSAEISIDEALGFEEIFPLFHRVTLSNAALTTAVLNGSSIATEGTIGAEGALVGVFREPTDLSESEWSRFLGMYSTTREGLRPDVVISRLG